MHTELAFAYFEKGQMAVALDEVKTALASKPSYFAAYNVLGLINMDLGENVKAEDAFRHALEIAPGDSDTLNNYGWFLCQTQRERQAIPAFMRALKNPLYATPAKPYLNAGICTEKMATTPPPRNITARPFPCTPPIPGPCCTSPSYISNATTWTRRAFTPTA